MVVIAILGVVKLVPVPTKFPNVGASYQFIVPLDATACNVTVPASHLLPGVVEVILGTGLIVAVTAVLGEVQKPLVTST